METTFYDDPRSKEDIRILKRNLKLDLESPKPSKKQRFTALLSSPDLNMLKLASPELEKFIIAQNGLVTTTPTPTQFLFPKNVTEEQELYARGFVDALAQLHQSSVGSNGVRHVTIESLPAVTSVPTTENSGSCTVQSVPVSYQSLTTLSVQVPVEPIDNNGCSLSPSSNIQHFSTSRSVPTTGTYPAVTSSYLTPSVITVKDEPQTVPSAGITPPLSPIDMENQERIKLERKRLRNRIAASKCRRRKLERIARLEDKVRLLKGENNELGAVVNKLREQVCQLKQQVLDHIKSGCEIMISHNF